MRTDNRTTKQKLIDLVSALEEENIIDYCYTFIGLKVYGQTKLPESTTAELRQMWEEHFNLSHEVEQEQERHEQTAEEKQVVEYRCNITRILYDIESLAILNYINIIVSDVAKEDKDGANVVDERMKAIAELLKEIENIDNIAKIRFLSGVVRSYNGKGRC